MAEGARLLSEYRVQTLSGVRIPSSPPVYFCLSFMHNCEAMYLWRTFIYNIARIERCALFRGQS